MDNSIFQSQNSFDTEVNSELLTNTQDTKSGIVSNLIGGSVATAVDIGASLWNSLPGTDEVDTEQILGRINGDALRVYQENPDTIRTLSLIGGSILPGGMALKGMTALRNGSKAVNWFSTAGRQTDIAKAAEMVANGAKGTSEYKKLMWGMRGKSVANNLLDTAVAEAAVLGAFNGHSYMEDYFQDPLKNFGISMALGGTLGVAGGMIVDNFALKRAVGEVEEKALAPVLEALRPIAPAMPDATKIQEINVTIQNLDNILKQRKDAGLIENNDLTAYYAGKAKRDAQLQQHTVLDAMLSPELRDLPVNEKNFLMDQINGNNGFWGVTSIKSVAAKDLFDRKTFNNLFTDEPVLKTTNAAGKTVTKKGVYFPELQKFGTKDDVAHHAGMSALNLSEKDLLKQVPDKISSVPNFDYSLEMIGKTTPAVEAEYAAWALKFSKMEDDAFESYVKKALLGQGDIPQLQAMLFRMDKTPRLRNTLGIRIADATGQSNAILDEVNIARTLGGTPVRYQEAAEKLLNNNTVVSKYSVEKYDGVHEWISGSGVYDLQKGATAYFAKGFSRHGARKDRELADKFATIYESPESIALRKDLATLADKDGKIYLYRGVDAPKIYGQNPLESMAITLQKAQQFSQGVHGKNLLYKVDVDDVVGAVLDSGPLGDNVEVIVRASAREAEATLSADGRIAFRESMSSSLKKPEVATEMRYGDIAESLQESKYSIVQNLLQRGYPIESIAKRANVSTNTVEQFIASDRSLDSFTFLNRNIGRFQTAEDVAEANSIRNRPLVVGGDAKKITYSKTHANLNAADLTNIDSLFKGTVLLNSKSSSVNSVGKLLMEEQKQMLDIVRSQLSKVTESAAGNRFINSADFFARNLGDLGPAFSYIGKALEKISNDTTKRVVEPISKLMNPLANDLPSLTEFSVSHNINAGLKGWRIYKDRQFWQKVESVGEDGAPVTILKPVEYQGAPYTIKDDNVDKLWTEMQARSGELYELSNASNKIIGRNDMNSIGLWVPSFNPVNKHLAYVHNQATDETRLLWGKSANELEDAIKSFNTTQKADPNIMIVRKSDQEWWSKLNGRLDTIRMQRADTGQLHTGSGASALPKISIDTLAEVAGGYEHHINSQIRNLADLTLSDITDTLKQISSIANAGYDSQPLGFVQKIVSKPKDAALTMRNILLGNPSLGEYDGWKSANSVFETGISMASSAATQAWRTITAPILGNPFRKGGVDASKLKEADYQKFSDALAERGIVNPFATLDKASAIERYGLSRLEDSPDVSKRIVTASNGLAATVALRFGELAHPLVNLVSMPILMALANSSKMPSHFMGVAKGTADVPLTQIMYEGVRGMHSPRLSALNKKWEDLGYFKPLVSEASEALRASRSFEKGAIATIERALDSSFVNTLSKPADYSEALSRKFVMNAGASLAKRLYPELDDNGVTIFARDFMDKALGNYSASQRPVLFQGTAGVAMGLFQTYMLTLAQNTYRAVELKDWKSLAKAMLAQQTVFGSSSMPGFDAVSKTIAENFSDDNFDLTTGTYRALGDPLADWVLYGLPSNLSGAALHTRGDIDPRVPNLLGGVDNLVSANFAVQTFGMMKNFAKAVSVENEDVGQAMLQALSLQTMSRPLARVSELGSGYSMTQQGNTVQIPDEVRTVNGVMARVLGTRPMAEAKLREAMHLNAYYGSVDRDNRNAVVNDLRTSIRNGTVTSEKVAEIAEKYMRNGGTPRGWKAAYNNALAKTNMSGEDAFLSKVQEDSPFNFMIGNLE